MAMPVRTMSKWARGPRRVAALLAVWQSRPGYCALSSPASLPKRAELVLEEGRVGLVGRGEVAHEAGQQAAGVGLLAQRRTSCARTPRRPMPGVELDVHPGADPGGLGDEGRRPADDLGASAAARARPVPVSGPKIRMGTAKPGLTQLFGLGRRRHAEPGGPGLQRGARRGDRAVAVAVGLDDGAVDGAVGVGRA